MTSMWTSDTVRLRAVEPEDWQAFQRFDEHSADMRKADMIHPPRSAARMREWATEQALRQASPDELNLAIESCPQGVLVGALSTNDIDRRAGRFHHGIAIGHEHQRRGYEASIALHRKVGFRVEGTLRDHEYFAGRHHDLVVLGMTAPEFADRHPFPDLASS